MWAQLRTSSSKVPISREWSILASAECDLEILLSYNRVFQFDPGEGFIQIIETNEFWVRKVPRVKH